jgi:hypothetical protein
MRYAVSVSFYTDYRFVGFPLREADARQWLSDSKEGEFVSLIWHPDSRIRKKMGRTFGVATTTKCPTLNVQRVDEVLVIRPVLPISVFLPKRIPSKIDYTYMLLKKAF